jgi:hypothetical protein
MDNIIWTVKQQCPALILKTLNLTFVVQILPAPVDGEVCNQLERHQVLSRLGRWEPPQAGSPRWRGDYLWLSPLRVCVPGDLQAFGVGQVQG